jgi:hypothetical protein
VGDAVWITVSPMVRGGGEHERVVVESGAKLGAAALARCLWSMRMVIVSWSSLITRIW